MPPVINTFSCGSRLMLPLFQFDFDQGCMHSNAAACARTATLGHVQKQIDADPRS
jgi:hypothetical protein